MNAACTSLLAFPLRAQKVSAVTSFAPGVVVGRAVVVGAAVVVARGVEVGAAVVVARGDVVGAAVVVARGVVVTAVPKNQGVTGVPTNVLYWQRLARMRLRAQKNVSN